MHIIIIGIKLWTSSKSVTGRTIIPRPASFRLLKRPIFHRVASLEPPGLGSFTIAGGERLKRIRIRARSDYISYSHKLQKKAIRRSMIFLPNMSLLTRRMTRKTSASSGKIRIQIQNFVSLLYVSISKMKLRYQQNLLQTDGSIQDW